MLKSLDNLHMKWEKLLSVKWSLDNIQIIANTPNAGETEVEHAPSNKMRNEIVYRKPKIQIQ